ncbi:MAG: PHP domain-containing protein [Chloroflexi bacterium]|nr:PHP domain-containing protein [Chloroflexota bacterium]
MPDNTTTRNQKMTKPQDNSVRIKVDLHIHTCYSPDSLTSLEAVIAAALERGLGALAITDHNAIQGALALQRMAPFPVIIGEEILTSEGDIIGLFLQELIPPRLTPLQTIARIREQGGLVYIPHPFDYRRSALPQPTLFAILDQVDAMEVLNARTLLPALNERAQRFAQERGLLCGAGSDAHTAAEIGQAYVEIPPFRDRDSFLHSLAEATVHGTPSLPHVHLFSTWAKIWKGKGG